MAENSPKISCESTPVKDSTINGDNGKPTTNSNQYFNDNLFPEHTSDRKDVGPSLIKKYVLGDSNTPLDKYRCERNVLKCIEESPLVKLMISALKTVGCEIDLLRHITCEVCTGNAMGGYDSQLKQVVICQNSCNDQHKVQGTLAHEFVHMFDDCRANMDFENIEHLACTEIRAANLLNCSFMTAVTEGKASPINIAQTHGECVKALALKSVLAVRNITPEEGMVVINKVFDKCYVDLEPLGRRLRRNSSDMERAYRDRYLLGYYE